MKEPVYTHNEAAEVVSIFENLLINNGIRVPSSDDDERDSDDVGLYGDTYSNLLDSVEGVILDLIQRKKANGGIVHEAAFSVIQEFETLCLVNKISVPGPDDAEREKGEEYGMYGTTYTDALDDVEVLLTDILMRSRGAEIIKGVFE